MVTYEDRAWNFLSQVVVEIVKETHVRVLFNRVLFSNEEGSCGGGDPSSFRLCYEGTDELFEAVLRTLYPDQDLLVDEEQLRISFTNKCAGLPPVYVGQTWEQLKNAIKQAGANRSRTVASLFRLSCVYQASSLGFAPQVINVDEAARFFDVALVPSRKISDLAKELRKKAKKKKAKEEDWEDLVAYAAMQVLEDEYLKLSTEGTTSVVSIFPLSPLWRKSGFFFVWYPYEKGNDQALKEALRKMEDAERYLRKLLPQMTSVVALLLGGEIFEETKATDQAEGVVERVLPSRRSIEPGGA
ncbi:hypothetical protein EG19_06805 [Thermoanaerobaculum aquaticum]|uniref:Uncharacterized protein n=1 Tax=Thermoanaerobaculum aquaticum TaxID=1312852 RepID=A0A062XXF6_9BACT|nr:hypothetical protein [Thermoanaerobaculum aquaticum]KDA53190.1 hypothetical protein EG19_06805 [Thermoanaerobaculum aquaticum]